MNNNQQVWNWEWTPKPGQSLDWARLNTLDWVQALAGTPQSPVHHAEGDVWIHTRMVMEALLELAGFQSLGEADRSVLFLATLAHDIAKPMCTEVDAKGEVTSPHHAQRGRSLLRQEVYRGNPGPMPFALREHAVQLVRYHGLPLWFMHKPDMQAAVIKASLVCNLQHLALLAEADVRGRICQDQSELLERIAFFREYCEEQGVWHGPWPFKNGHAQHVYVQHPDNGPLYEPFDNLKGEAILMCGMPGSGKDTWVAQNGEGRPVISLDAMREDLDIGHKDNQGRLIQAAKEKAKEYLRKGTSFIWNATNLIPSIRHQLIGLFSDYGARTRIVYIEVPYGRMLRQNASRSAKVPDNVMQQMVRKWDVPEPWEAVQVDYVVSEKE